MTKSVRSRTRPAQTTAPEPAAPEAPPGANDDWLEDAGGSPGPDHQATPEDQDPVKLARIKIAVLMAIAGSSQAEIARRLRCTERTVRSYLDQGRSVGLGIAESIRPEHEIARVYLRIEAQRAKLARVQEQAEAEGNYAAAIRGANAIAALDGKWIAILHKLGLFKRFTFDEGERAPGSTDLDSVLSLFGGFDDLVADADIAAADGAPDAWSAREPESGETGDGP